MQVCFFYFMKNNPELIGKTVPDHIEYWKKRAPDGYKGGPFADRSGGMIQFNAQCLAEAQAIVEQDPFILNELLESHWLKEWLAG